MCQFAISRGHHEKDFAMTLFCSTHILNSLFLKIFAFDVTCSITNFCCDVSICSITSSFDGDFRHCFKRDMAKVYQVGWNPCPMSTGYVLFKEQKIKRFQWSSAQEFITHQLLAVFGLLSEKEGKVPCNPIDICSTFLLSKVFTHLLNSSISAMSLLLYKLSTNWQTDLHGLSAVIWICPYQECTTQEKSTMIFSSEQGLTEDW